MLLKPAAAWKRHEQYGKTGISADQLSRMHGKKGAVLWYDGTPAFPLLYNS
jgi:hypothetical protein